MFALSVPPSCKDEITAEQVSAVLEQFRVQLTNS